MLFAGVSERIITPDFPTLMAGYPLPKDRYHNKVNDDLKAHCFYLKNGETEVAIITLDLIGYTKRRVKMVREQINKACGIPTENILISTTHTHSAPVCGSVPFEHWDDRKEMYPYYLDQVNDKIAEGIKEAKETAFPAKIGMGKGHCGKEQGVGGNRRDKDGLTDPEVWVTAIKDENDKLRGILVNYALHPTFLHAESKTITADYPAYIYEYLKKQNNDIVVGFQNGAAGNQSSRHFRTGQNFDEARRVGYAIGEEAERVIKNLTFENNPTLVTDRVNIVPSTKRIPSIQEARATKEASEKGLEDSRKNNEPYAIQRTWECTLIGANNMLKKAEGGEKVLEGLLTNSPNEIFMLGIGENRIIAVPFEIFVEYALRLKKESPYKNTYLASTSNGYGSGYICTPESYKEGGYEPIGSMYTETAGDEIIDAALELLKK